MNKALFYLLAWARSHQLSSLLWPSDYMIVCSQPAAVGVTDVLACDGQSHVKRAKCDCQSSQHVACQLHAVANRQ